MATGLSVLRVVIYVEIESTHANTAAMPSQVFVIIITRTSVSASENAGRFLCVDGIGTAGFSLSLYRLLFTVDISIDHSVVYGIAWMDGQYY